MLPSTVGLQYSTAGTLSKPHFDLFSSCLICLADVMLGKILEETEESLKESHLESRSSSCVQSKGELLEDHKTTNAPVVSDSAKEVNDLLETLYSDRRADHDDFKTRNETPQCVAEKPVISKDDLFLVTTGSEDMQNDHKRPQQIGYDQLTVHTDRSNDGSLYRGEAVIEKSENSKCEQYLFIINMINWFEYNHFFFIVFESTSLLSHRIFFICPMLLYA